MVSFIAILFGFGLIFGSFLTSFTYRFPIGEFLPQGRSYCPRCKRRILWFDNIPLFSYLLLGGKCRSCKKHIALRYPFIELVCGVIFVCIGLYLNGCLWIAEVCTWGVWTLPFWLFVSLILVAILIIDFEHQIIPDELSFLLLTVFLILLICFGNDSIYIHVLSGFSAALFLLTLHLVTFGRGMGLGDVKLALGIGIFLGWPYTLLWLLFSFVFGSVVGVLLLSFKKVRFGKHIAFGPFLIAAFFVVLLWGERLAKIVMPYI